jgi:hypothetical protein
MPRLHLGRCQAIRLVLEQGPALPTHGPTRAHARGAWLSLWRDSASRGMAEAGDASAGRLGPPGGSQQTVPTLTLLVKSSLDSRSPNLFTQTCYRK